MAKKCNRQFLNDLPVPVTAGLLFFALFFLFNGCGITPPASTGYPGDESPTSQLIHFYQGPLNHLSAVRTGECPMYPGCSEYGLSAIKKHGAWIGWMMTFDRLIRCGMDETRLSPEILVNGTWKYVDTLDQNDFWWNNNCQNNELLISHPSEQALEWDISVE